MSDHHPESDSKIGTQSKTGSTQCTRIFYSYTGAFTRLTSVPGIILYQFDWLGKGGGMGFIQRPLGKRKTFKTFQEQLVIANRGSHSCRVWSRGSDCSLLRPLFVGAALFIIFPKSHFLIEVVELAHCWLIVGSLLVWQEEGGFVLPSEKKNASEVYSEAQYEIFYY